MSHTARCWGKKVFMPVLKNDLTIPTLDIWFNILKFWQRLLNEISMYSWDGEDYWPLIQDNPFNSISSEHDTHFDLLN